jgi:hypothetical protein
MTKYKKTASLDKQPLFQFEPTAQETRQLRKLKSQEEKDGWAQAIFRRTYGVGQPVALKIERPGVDMIRAGIKPVCGHITVFEYNGLIEVGLTGYELRKDGAVGSNMGSLRLTGNCVWRRHLDGSWRPLLPTC